MSARKRARTSRHAPPVSQHEPLAGQATPLTTRWHTLPPELMQLVTTYLLGSPPSTFSFIQLLCRLSAVCVDWHGMVYRTDSGAGRADLWAIAGTASVVKSLNGRKVSVAGRSFRVAVLPHALASLRHVRSLLLDFGGRRTLQGMAEGLDELQLYTRLVSLDLDLTSAYGNQPTKAHGRAQEALNAALDAVTRHPTPIFSLAVRCLCGTPDPDAVRPTAGALRRLFSSVQQLSLTASELMLMTRGTDSPGGSSSSDDAWIAQSVRSLVLPSRSYWHLSTDRAVETLTAALPSVVMVNVQSERDVAIVSALLRRVCNRLTFLRATTDQLLRFPSEAPSYSSLTSLFLVDIVYWQSSRLSDDQICGIFASLTDCTVLRELTVITTVITCARTPFPVRALFLAALPLLTYLHLRIDQPLTGNDVQQLCSTLLTPNLAHLALALHESQSVDTLQAIDAQLHQLPHLAHFFIGRIHSPTRLSGEWREERRRLSERLGDVWCEKEDDVLCWRADRLWRRSVGLSDEADKYVQ